MSKPPLYVYQLIDTQLFTLGIFDSLDKAREAAKNKWYQINRIPLNVVGNYGEYFDIVDFHEEDISTKNIEQDENICPSRE